MVSYGGKEFALKGRLQKKKPSICIQNKEGVGVNCAKGSKPDTCWTV